jgi:hypothetical protein
MRSLMLAALAAALAAASCGKTLRPGYCRVDTDCPNGLKCDAREGGSWMCGEAGMSPDGGDARDGDAGEVGDAADGPKPFQCTSTADCMDAAMPGVCEPDARMCVQCTTSENTCSGNTPICSDTKCVRCTASPQCAGRDGGVCEPDAGACVECIPTESNCTGQKPVCAGTRCVPCAKDSDCKTGPAVCMPDGHCASDGEVIFVDYGATTCPGSGSSTTPYCTFTDAMGALDSARPALVILGPADGKLMLSTVDIKPLVIGRKNAAGVDPSIPAGAGTAILVASDEVLIRNLLVTASSSLGAKGIVATGSSTKLSLVNVKVSLGMGLGLQADTGAELMMDSSYIENNSTGGLLINGASYSIENSVFAGNGYGIKFNATVIPRASHVSFSTIVGNVGNAVTCDSTNTQTLTDSIVVGVNDSCTLMNCVQAMPTFRSAPPPYHLMSHVSCPGMPSVVPTHDIDGDPRTGPTVDCGADQLVP